MSNRGRMVWRYFFFRAEGAGGGDRSRVRLRLLSGYRPLMPDTDEKLTPADPRDLVGCLAYALTNDRPASTDRI